MPGEPPALALDQFNHGIISGQGRVHDGKQCPDAFRSGEAVGGCRLIAQRILEAWQCRTAVHPRSDHQCGSGSGPAGGAFGLQDRDCPHPKLGTAVQGNLREVVGNPGIAETSQESVPVLRDAQLPAGQMPNAVK